jgi:hypothetical protein
MILLDQIITDQEIQAIRNSYESFKDNSYVNWTVNEKLIDVRFNIEPTSPEFSIIESIVKKNFKNPIISWSGYQRQTNPHNIHIDDYGSDQSNPTYTYVISLDTIPEFKTIIWKETAKDNKELHSYVAHWGEIKDTLTKVNNISETEDLEHTFDENQNAYMCDYLTLDGIYTYKKGSGVLFNAKQFHCTSNWVKYNRWPYRELLQIHVTVPKEEALIN